MVSLLDMYLCVEMDMLSYKDWFVYVCSCPCSCAPTKPTTPQLILPTLAFHLY